jgi:hypothetical protein
MMKSLANYFVFLCFSSPLQLTHAGVLRDLEINAMLVVGYPVWQNMERASAQSILFFPLERGENHIERCARHCFFD